MNLADSRGIPFGGPRLSTSRATQDRQAHCSAGQTLPREQVESRELSYASTPLDIYVREAAMSDEHAAIIERHALCNGYHPAGSQVCRNAATGVAICRMGTLDEERAQ